MFCKFPDSKSEWKKGTTGQSFIQKEIASYRIGTLTNLLIYKVIINNRVLSKKCSPINNMGTIWEN